MMTKEEYNTANEEVYNNLSKEQFDALLNNCESRSLRLILKQKIFGYNCVEEIDDKIVKFIYDSTIEEKTEDKTIKFIFQSPREELTESEQFAIGVFNTVYYRRNLSFKQFKLLSAFSKTNWILTTKQF